MPYIHVNTSKVLSAQEKDDIAAGLGARIGAIPGKSEKALMIDIADGHTMYFAGEKGEYAYVGVEIYGTTEFENQKALTEAVFETLHTAAGLGEGQVYVTFSEFPHWGTKGSMK